MSVDSARCADAGRVVIGIGGLVVRQSQAGVIVTHALGSCLGIAVYEKANRIGGMLHAQLPLSGQNPQRAAVAPTFFVDLGLRMLLQAVADLGADRKKLRLTVAGAANMTASTTDIFQIANRNLTVFRKTLWQEGLLVAGEDVGGVIPRTMTLQLDSGQTVIESQGQRHVL